MSKSVSESNRQRQVRVTRVSTQVFDLLVIGGGATGLGVAIEAASRGLNVALVEAKDFAKGTSSRATKMLHGGVRYLAQGNIGLVREALRERTTLLNNAPHLAQPMPFVMPVYGLRGRLFDKWFYGAGLLAYDHLAGSFGLGKTEFLNADEAVARMPGIQAEELSGAVQYWDGQFDDAGLAVALARTAMRAGACVINYCPVTGLVHDGERIAGAYVTDSETGLSHTVNARCVVNATGVWVDSIRRMDHSTAPDLVAPSQGVHLVVDQEFLPGGHGLLVPKTKDGRVLFAVPWLGKVILGTTDTPRGDLALEPDAFPQEINFILHEAGNYLARKPEPRDVRSMWVGLRPLVKPPTSEATNTKNLSREHTVLISPSQLVTVTGGKWTTYRAMAEDVLEHCIAASFVVPTRSSGTSELALVGAPDRATHGHPVSAGPGIHLYGTDADCVLGMPGSDRELSHGLTEAMVRFAVRHQFARTVEDVLARRSRLLFLDAEAAIAVAGETAVILKDELGCCFDAERSVEEFSALAGSYLIH